MRFPLRMMGAVALVFALSACDPERNLSEPEKELVGPTWRTEAAFIEASPIPPTSPNSASPSSPKANGTASRWTAASTPAPGLSPNQTAPSPPSTKTSASSPNTTSPCSTTSNSTSNSPSPPANWNGDWFLSEVRITVQRTSSKYGGRQIFEV